jgi:hypothetical protein
MARLADKYQHPSEPKPRLGQGQFSSEARGIKIPKEADWYVAPEDIPGWQFFSRIQKEALRILPMFDSDAVLSKTLGKSEVWLSHQKDRVPKFKEACRLRLMIKANDRLGYFLAEAEVVSAMMLHKILYDDTKISASQIKTAQWFIERRDKLIKQRALPISQMDSADKVDEYDEDQIDAMLSFTTKQPEPPLTPRQIREHKLYEAEKLAGAETNGSDPTVSTS